MARAVSYLDAIREALDEEMRRHQKVFVLGEGLGPSRRGVGAKGMLKDAIRDDNPVIYFEHKYLYRRAKGPVPEGDEIVPIGEAAIRREGGDITLLTYGAMVAPSLEAADRLAKEGVEVEVVDLRTLMPFDKAAIFASLDKTSRVLVVHEDVKTLGLGAEISAVIMEEKLAALDAPVL